MSRRTKNEMRFYSNENFPLPAVEKLRQLGHDVLTVAESGHAGQAWADEEVLRFATKDRRAVLTMNRRHFIRLHDASPEHGGIIVCTFDPSFAALAERIHAAIPPNDLLHGMLLRINRPSSVEPRLNP